LQADPEIRDNELAEKTIELVDRLRPYFNTILLAAAGLILATAAWILVSSQSAATKAQSWDAYLAGLAGGDVQAFDEVLRRYPGTPAAEWSRLVLADMALTEGTELLFVNKDRAPPRLQTAVEIYAAILATRPAGMLAERATFGLAKARESLGQLEEARQGYAAVAAEFPSGALAQMASDHAAELTRESSRQWYDWFAAQKITPPAAQKPAADAPAAAAEAPASAPAVPDKTAEKTAEEPAAKQE
ncbi:MAG: hypothetical protein WCJ18_11950, partial [Planctomycetota bacterium]